MTVAPVSNIATPHRPQYVISLAHTPDDMHELLRLRYDVFVRDLGAGGPLVDHAQRLEQDAFDVAADHLTLRDMTRPKGAQIIGVYRLLDQRAADTVGGFYTEAEFDLTALHTAGRPLLELGRSCLHPDYRGGAALMHLWQGLASYITDRDINLLFGTASFPGTDLPALAAPLSILHHTHLAPKNLRAISRSPDAVPWRPIDQIDRLTAMRQTPALIKAYLRLGGVIGQGVFVDHAFNCTDVCMILDRQSMLSDRSRLYTQNLDQA